MTAADLKPGHYFARLPGGRWDIVKVEPTPTLGLWCWCFGSPSRRSPEDFAEFAGPISLADYLGRGGSLAGLFDGAQDVPVLHLTERGW